MQFQIEKWEERKHFQLEKGKYSTEKKENILIRKRKIFLLEKGNHSKKKKENIPIRKRKIFQLEKKNIPTKV